MQLGWRSGGRLREQNICALDRGLEDEQTGRGFWIEASFGLAYQGQLFSVFETNGKARLYFSFRALTVGAAAFRFGSCFHGPDTNAARREEAREELSGNCGLQHLNGLLCVGVSQSAIKLGLHEEHAECVHV